MIPLCERVLGAYGGAERWQSAAAVEAVVSSGGLAFRLKWQPKLRAVRVRAEVADPRVRLEPIGGDGCVGVLFGHDVQLEDRSGEVLQKRFKARQYFPSGRRLLWWDALDQVYFAGSALWNYLTFPALLMRDDVRWLEKRGTTLAACFRSHLPTHCPLQFFHFDPATFLLKQHDYTAEVFGPWAKSAHVVLAHDSWQGVPYPCKRRVTPRHHSGRPWRWPVLVWIEVHDWRLV
jgi:hypothetical protein